MMTIENTFKKSLKRRAKEWARAEGKMKQREGGFIFKERRY